MKFKTLALGICWIVGSNSYFFRPFRFPYRRLNFDSEGSAINLNQYVDQNGSTINKISQTPIQTQITPNISAENTSKQQIIPPILTSPTPLKQTVTPTPTPSVPQTILPIPISSAPAPPVLTSQPLQKKKLSFNQIPAVSNQLPVLTPQSVQLQMKKQKPIIPIHYSQMSQKRHHQDRENHEKDNHNQRGQNTKKYQIEAKNAKRLPQDKRKNQKRNPISNRERLPK